MSDMHYRNPYLFDNSKPSGIDPDEAYGLKLPEEERKDPERSFSKTRLIFKVMDLLFDSIELNSLYEDTNHKIITPTSRENSKYHLSDITEDGLKNFFKNHPNEKLFTIPSNLLDGIVKSIKSFIDGIK